MTLMVEGMHPSFDSPRDDLYSLEIFENIFVNVLERSFGIGAKRKGYPSSGSCSQVNDWKFHLVLGRSISQCEIILTLEYSRFFRMHVDFFRGANMSSFVSGKS